MGKVLATASLAALLFGLGNSAHAAIAVTDGNFETGGGFNADVTDWFDTSSADFWQGTWQWDAGFVSPNGSTVVILGSYEGGAIRNTPSANVNDGNSVYQGIGTADGANTLSVGFDWGAPNDDPGGRALGLTVGVYAWDGNAGFTPGDATDVRGAAGVTLLDAESFSMTSTGVDGQIAAAIASLDISGAGTQQLFLRFNNYRSSNTESWPVLDNVTVAVPEPTSLAALALGTSALLRRRRR